MNKVTIEVDIDAILTAHDKANALYKAIKEDLLGRSSMVQEMREKITNDLVKEVAYATLKTKIADEINKIYASPEAIKKLVESKQYDISNMVALVIKERKDLLETEVLRYMAKTDFQKHISQTVERNLTARVEQLIMPARDYGDND